MDLLHGRNTFRMRHRVARRILHRALVHRQRHDVSRVGADIALLMSAWVGHDSAGRAGRMAARGQTFRRSGPRTSSSGPWPRPSFSTASYLYTGYTRRLQPEAVGRSRAALPSAAAHDHGGDRLQLTLVPFHSGRDVFEGAPMPVTAYLSIASKGTGLPHVRCSSGLGDWVDDWSLMIARLPP